MAETYSMKPDRDNGNMGCDPHNLAVDQLKWDRTKNISAIQPYCETNMLYSSQHSHNVTTFLAQARKNVELKMK